jgi:hypothetical protein
MAQREATMTPLDLFGYIVAVCFGVPFGCIVAALVGFALFVGVIVALDTVAA